MGIRQVATTQGKPNASTLMPAMPHTDPALYPLPAIGLALASLGAGIYGGGLIGARFPLLDHHDNLGHETSLEPSMSQPKLLDTSTIIDGRIAELCETGFLEGPFLLPSCVLAELQWIADSNLPTKRVRGKRGLEILNRLQTMKGIVIRPLESPPTSDQDVDWQLIDLAKAHQAKILTNDWNLTKVASLQGITTLNVHELCFRLKPAILPGEILRVHLLKEGQSPEQAIAHLDDGTLVVVERGKPFIGTNQDIQVGSIHQTQSGRMLFGTIVPKSQPTEPNGAAT